MKRLILVSVLSAASITNLMAQDMSSAYSVWGFSAPFLKSGEFIVTGGGSYSTTDYEYTYENDPDYYSISNYSYKNLTTRGILAITDKFLVNLSVYYYPTRENMSKYGDNDYENKSKSTQQAYINPYLTLIYRPLKNLELSGTIYGYNNEQKYEQTYSNPEQEPYAYSYDYKYSGGSISVNYFGKLWSK